MQFVLDFLIDDDQLADNSKQQAFVLGFELGRAWQLMQIENVGGFSAVIHAVNCDRMKAAAEAAGFDVAFAMFHDDWVTATFERWDSDADDDSDDEDA